MRLSTGENMIALKDWEAQCLLILLRKLDDVLSVRGCNDFFLSEDAGIHEPQVWLEINNRFHQLNGDPENSETDSAKCEYTADTNVLYILKRHIEAQVPPEVAKAAKESRY